MSKYSHFSGFWNDKECDAVMNYVCKMDKIPVNQLDEQVEGCPTGWKANGASCYLFDINPSVWVNAEEFCKLVWLQELFLMILLHSEMPLFLSYSYMIFLPVRKVVTWPPLTTSQSKFSWPVKRHRPHIRVMTSTFTSVSRRTSTPQGPWALTGRRANLSLLLLGVLENLVSLFGQLVIRNVFHFVRFSHLIFKEWNLW